MTCYTMTRASPPAAEELRLAHSERRVETPGPNTTAMSDHPVGIDGPG